MLPAVALVPSKNIKLPLPPELASTKFCVTPELFVIPVPLTVNEIAESTVIVKEGVSEAVNVIPPISMLEEIKREVTLDRLLNVATSVVPELPG